MPFALSRLLTLPLLLVSIFLSAQTGTFRNPILPSGADPYSTYHEGYYYYSNSDRGSQLMLRRTRTLDSLQTAEKKIVWSAPRDTTYSREVWAPEVHFIDGKWYIYFAADDGDNNHHRMYVIENTSPDPFKGSWIFRGKLATPSDKWAIDADIFRFKGQLYMTWSGWEGDSNGRQDLYLARMKNPYTLEGERVLISKPELEWERQWKGGPEVYVNEGPQFLERNGKTFIVYSASGCWTDHYSLGLLTLEGDDPMKPGAWHKTATPLFSTSIANGVYSPGHNSFFKSPDGKQDWILYHANDNPGDGCGGKRSPRMQPITWKPDGTPEFGEPVPRSKSLPVPAR